MRLTEVAYEWGLGGRDDNLARPYTAGCRDGITATWPVWERGTGLGGGRRNVAIVEGAATRLRCVLRMLHWMG